MGEVRASHEQPRKRRLRKCGASRLIVITSIYRETQTASCFTLSNGVYRDIYIYKLCPVNSDSSGQRPDLVASNIRIVIIMITQTPSHQR